MEAGTATEGARRTRAVLQRGVAAGLVCTAIFLALALRHAEWGPTLAALRRAHGSLLALGTLALVATYVVFALRWRVLLAATAEVSRVDAFSYIMIGYLANTLLPLRLGDVTRATLLGRRYRRSTAQVLGSVVLERVLDVVALLIVTLAVSTLMEIPRFARASIQGFAVAGLGALAALAVMARSGVAPGALAARVPGLRSSRLAGALLAKAGSFADGLSALRQAPSLAVALLLSAAAWLLAAAGTCLYVAAFGLAAPWYAGVFVLVVVNLGTAIPSSPGFVGVYHFLAALALGVWAPDRSATLAYAIGTHALNVAVNVMLGCVSVGRVGLTMRAVSAASGSHAALARGAVRGG